MVQFNRPDLESVGGGQQEPGGVPDFIGEIAPNLELLFREKDVLALGGYHDDAETERVGAELVDHVDGIDGVAQRFAHLGPGIVADGAVDINVAEGNVAHKLKPGHNHPRDPEEDYLRRGRKHVGGVVELEVLVVTGPAESRERPQPR